MLGSIEASHPELSMAKKCGRVIRKTFGIEGRSLDEFMTEHVSEGRNNFHQEFSHGFASARATQSFPAQR
jgi:hypothetical protein